MGATLSALGPVFAWMAFGFGLRRVPQIPDALFHFAGRLVYWVCFPALLIRTLAAAPPVVAGRSLALGAVVAVAGVVALSFFLRRALRIDGPRFTSLLQGAIRHNTYLGLAVIAALFGEAGVAVLSVLLAVVIPLVNLISVAALLRYGVQPATAAHPVGALLRAVASNPLVLACGLGISWQWGVGAPLPSAVDGVLRALSSLALPVGLAIVGAGLRFEGLRAEGATLVGALALKHVAYPLLLLGLGRALGWPPLVQQVAVLFGALPTASSAYVLAWVLGGTPSLMAAIITAESALAVIWLPFVAWCLA